MKSNPTSTCRAHFICFSITSMIMSAYNYFLISSISHLLLKRYYLIENKIILMITEQAEGNSFIVLESNVANSNQHIYIYTYLYKNGTQINILVKMYEHVVDRSSCSLVLIMHVLCAYSWKG